MGRFVRTVIAIGAVAALLPAWVAAQQVATISGRVTSESGAPLNSASVFVETMNIGSLTDADGKYTFQVPSARVKGQQVTITARLIGYRAQSVQVTLNPGEITHNFSLAANPLRLGEVVVTGEGTSTVRERLGSAVNSVDTSLVSKSNETNVVSALAGKAPNVEVVSASGDPGTSAYIRIRGPKTISGDGQPLFIIDGVPIDNSTTMTESGEGGAAASNRASDINPDDIASVDILKGAAASAIYGARAGAGVVIITTKRGQSGQTRYSLRSSYSFDKVTQGIPLNTVYGHGSGGVSPACDALAAPILDCGDNDPVAGIKVATSSSWGPKLSGVPIYNHFDDLFVTGHNWNSTLDISGGNDKTLYFVSGSLDNNHGDITGPNDWYKRNTVRVNASHQMFDNLKVGIDAQYSDVRAKYVQQGSNIDGLLLGSLRTPPEFNDFQYLDPTSGLQRSYRFPWPSVQSINHTRGYDNPIFTIYQQSNNSAVQRTFGNANVEWDALDWLKFKEVFGADYYTDQRLDGIPFTSSGQPTGSVIEGDLKNYILDHNLTATMTHTFSPSASANLTVGQNLNSTSFRQIFVTGKSLVSAQPFTLGNTTNWTPNDNQAYVHAERYFGSGSVYLWNQLNVEVSATNDGFSSFGASSRRHWFPSANFAWTFLQSSSDNRGFLNYGKLRGAYGEAGIQPNAYSTLQTFASGFSVGDGGWGDALLINQNGLGGLSQGFTKGQPNLGPERTKEFETGVDLGFLNNHADASITAYLDRTEGAIFSLPLPNSTGYGQITANAATIRNRGIETSFNFRPIMQQNLSWEIGVNWSKNENRLVALSGQQFADLGTGGGFTGAVPTAWYGASVGVLRGNDFARCGRHNPDGSDLNIDGVDINQACGNAKPGALYIDASGFPVVDPTQRVISDGNPKWLGSVHTSVTWNKITISGLLDVRHGGQTWDGTRGALYNFGAHKDTDIRDNGAIYVFGKNWLPGPVAGPGAGTAVSLDQGWFQGNGSGFGPVGSQFVEDAGFVKLREIGVAYSLDQSWVKNSGFSTIDLRLSARNLHTWTNYRGIDPEANLAGASSLIQGVDYFNNPQTRSFVFSLGLNR
ncbi:MAG TPA: SusC/RagA family TonB-linked outer membrane protein [Gemmatimonadaceae bacterium]|nr:SusC/RagA family TonB-linked outer membrane protein [Gemmatimonadaceae bacterium]